MTTAWVVLPTYNERENLATVVSLARAALATCDPPVEGTVLIVDDGSPDGTGELAEQLARDHDDVRVLHRARKGGLGGAYNAIAIADPSRGNVAAARRFGIGAERYWNPDLRPVPGYSRTPPGKVGRTWYDDEGWWGVAQFDAYRATHDRRFLADAARSLRFIDSGWDPVAGGIWWNDLHAFKASEGLAGGTLTAAGLFELTHRARYLALARKYIAWADRTIREPNGLYGARSSPRRRCPTSRDRWPRRSCACATPPAGRRTATRASTCCT
jgi:glycosyltransferase involved in cell wall biosynthesis